MQQGVGEQGLVPRVVAHLYRSPIGVDRLLEEPTERGVAHVVGVALLVEPRGEEEHVRALAPVVGVLFVARVEGRGAVVELEGRMWLGADAMVVAKVEALDGRRLPAPSGLPPIDPHVHDLAVTLEFGAAQRRRMRDRREGELQARLGAPGSIESSASERSSASRTWRVRDSVEAMAQTTSSWRTSVDPGR